MALPKIVATMGDIRLEDLERATGRQFGQDWTIRRGNPGSQGSTTKGFSSRKREHFVLGCGSVADLRRAAMLLAHEGRTSTLEVVLKSSGRQDLLSSRWTAGKGVSVRYEGGPEEQRLWRFAAGGPLVDIGQACSSLLRAAAPVANGYRVAVSDLSLTDWIGGGGTPMVGPGSFPAKEDVIAPCDIYLVAPGTAEAATENIEVGRTRSLGMQIVELSELDLHVVNPRTASPIGFDTEPDQESVRIRIENMQGSVWALAGPDYERVARSRLDHGLDEQFIQRLRRYRYVQLAPSTKSSPLEKGRLLANLAAAGVPTVGTMAWDVQGVHDEVLEGFRSIKAVDLADDLLRQSWSVGIRRAALKHHGASTRWRHLLPRLGKSVPAPQTISVIVASNRPDRLETMLGQVVGQNHKPAEILIGLHGCSHSVLSTETVDLLRGANAQIVEFDSSLALGEVLQHLTERAESDFVAKMDDDDFYSPHHLEDLLQALDYSQAQLVGCKAEFVYLETQEKTIQRRPLSESFGRSITGGTYLLSRHVLREVGGWPRVRTAEDRLLQNAIKGSGGSIYRIHGLNYIMGRGDGQRTHTWNPTSGFFETQAVSSFVGLGFPTWTTAIEAAE